MGSEVVLLTPVTESVIVFIMSVIQHSSALHQKSLNYAGGLRGGLHA